MTGERHITVPADDHGQRLDRWLKKTAPDLPYGLMQKLIRKGAIRVADQKAKPDKTLEAGQTVRIPQVKTAEARQNRRKKLSRDDADFIKSLVIYDDGYVLALNKPPGLAVQGGSKIKRHVDGMLEAFTNKEGVRPRLVHRLDKDTSGVLLLARSAEVARKLGKMFKGRHIRKIYWALVTPTPEIHEGTVKAPLAKGGGPQKEKMQVDEEEGKFALTDYIVLDHAADKAAFVAFQPKTGRTHQIRAHAALMGCPILGDGKYGGQATVLEGFPHPKTLHLHAQRLILPHPVKKTMLDISAPLPPDLAKSWRALGFEFRPDIDPFAQSG